MDKGIIAVITNNSFYDGISHRKMREALLTTFDKIYILNLHGNSRIKEKTPEGTVDENVFDILVGTGITIFIKDKSLQKKKSSMMTYLEAGSINMKNFYQRH